MFVVGLKFVWKFALDDKCGGLVMVAGAKLLAMGEDVI
jgi:hypothetical protein